MVSMKDQLAHWNHAHAEQWLHAHSSQQTDFAEEVNQQIPAQAAALPESSLRTQG